MATEELSVDMSRNDITVYDEYVAAMVRGEDVTIAEEVLSSLVGKINLLLKQNCKELRVSNDDLRGVAQNMSATCEDLFNKAVSILSKEKADTCRPSSFLDNFCTEMCVLFEKEQTEKFLLDCTSSRNSQKSEYIVKIYMSDFITLYTIVLDVEVQKNGCLVMKFPEYGLTYQSRENEILEKEHYRKIKMRELCTDMYYNADVEYIKYVKEKTKLEGNDVEITDDVLSCIVSTWNLVLKQNCLGARICNSDLMDVAKNIRNQCFDLFIHASSILLSAGKNPSKLLEYRGTALLKEFTVQLNQRLKQEATYNLSLHCLDAKCDNNTHYVTVSLFDFVEVYIIEFTLIMQPTGQVIMTFPEYGLVLKAARA